MNCSANQTCQIKLCPVCGTGQLQSYAAIEAFEYKGAILTSMDYHYTCDDCGTTMASPMQIKKSVLAMNSAKIAHDELTSLVDKLPEQSDELESVK